MAWKGKGQGNPGRPPKLLRSRADVETLLGQQIQAGKNLLRRHLHTQELLSIANRDRRTWSDRTRAILQSVFDTDQILNEYGQGKRGEMFVNASFDQLVDEFIGGVQNTISSVESIVQRLDIYEQSSEQKIEPPEGKLPATGTSKVFIVHGHAEAVRERVALFIHRLGFEAVILSEQANTGQTVIEKIEKHSEVGYAVILFTADDVGGKAGTDGKKLQKRARQNVVLELGYFMAKLGRQNICVLFENGVEVPSDIAGVVYEPLSNSDSWQLRLAKEMKSAGLPVDMNKVL